MQPKTKKMGMFVNFTSGEIYQLRILAEDRETTMTNLLKNCVQVLWTARELEHSAETGNPFTLSVDGDNYRVNISELAEFSKEMAQILDKIDWNIVFQKVNEKPLNSQKKAIKQAV